MPLKLPFGTRVRTLGRQLAVAATALVLVTCTDNPTGPSIGGMVHLAVSPRFKSSVVLSPALPIDEARLVVYRFLPCDCAPDSVAGAEAPFSLTQDSIRMQLSFTLEQSPETLEVQFELLGQGQPLFYGDTTVIIRAGVAAQVPPVTVFYEGPGSDIAFLNVFPRDTVLTFGDSLQFTAQGSNSLEQPETAFYLSWSSSLTQAKIRPDGMIRAPNQRLTAHIKAQAPNGTSDSTTISFVPKPASLAKVSGDTQTASIATPLALPFTVRVKAADSLGVGGVRLVFHPLGFAGPVVPDTVYTDSLGFAETSATLSDSVGVQQWQVTGAGLTAVTFSATAQVVAGPPFRLKVLTQPADTQVNGALVAPSPVVQIEDSAGIPVHLSGIGVSAQTYSYLTGAPKRVRTLAKGARRAPSGGPYLNAGAFGTVDDTSDAQGKITFSGLRLSGYGSDRIIFYSDSLVLVADTSVQVFVKEGPPRQIFKASDDSSSSFVDSLVSVLPAVYVYDSTFNPVPHAAVVFQITAGAGQLPKPVDTVFTDSSGYAQLASWRLGSTPGTNSVQATVAGAGSITFTAFAQPPVPTVLLQLQGTSVIGVGRQATLLIRLSSPAGAGGDSVIVSSDNSGIVSVAAPGIFVAQGDSSGTITLNGVAAGTDTIRATAAGYISGAIGVTASVNLISLPTTLNVPFGGTANLSVTLAQPAPAGGVVVTVVSSDPTKVGVLTPTVSFAQGVQTQNAQLSGVALGSAVLTASNPNYANDSSLVTTAANLNIVAASSTIYPAFPDTQTIQFLSAGVPIAAPGGGISVTLAAADSTCVNVPAGALIPGGLSTVKFQASYAGVATVPCTTKIFATAAGVGADSATITVNKPPTIGSATLDLGASLQTPVTLSLQTPIQGTSSMTIRALTPGVARFAPDQNTAGVDTLVTPLTNGQGSVSVTVSGVDSIINDSTLVEVSIPGYAVDTALVRVRQPGVQIANVPSSTTSFTPTGAIWAQMGVPYASSPSIEIYQGLRAGHAPVVATFTVTPGTVAQLTDSSGVLDTVRTAVFASAPNVYYTPTQLSTGGVGYHPVGAGSSVTSVTIPGFVTLPGASASTTVSAPTINIGAPQVGAGLQTSASPSLGAITPSATTMTVKSLNPALLIVSDSIAKAGADSVMIPLPINSGGLTFYLQALEGTINDSARVVVTIPGYAPDSAWVKIRQPGVQLGNLPTTTTTFTPRSQFYAQIGLPYVGNSGIQAVQGLRAGATPLAVTFHTAQPLVGKLTDSTLVQDTVLTKALNFAANIYYTPTTVATGGVAYQPIGPGSSTTWVTIPGYVQVPGDTVVTTVSAPALNLSGAQVGSGLQVLASVSLGANTPAPDTLILVSQNPAAVKLAVNDSTPGTDSIAIPLAAGVNSITYYVQGMEGIVSDSSTIAATMTGYAFNQVRSYVRQAGVEIAGVSGTATTLSDSMPFYVQVGIPYVGNSGIQQYEALRAGGPGASFLVKVSDPSVQRFVTSGGVADSVLLTLLPKQYYSATTVATGGAALEVLTTGIDTVRATAAGFFPLPAATRQVVVSSPGISLSVPTVGSGLQVSASATLGAPRHGAMNVTIKSSNPGVGLVAPNATTAASDSIVIAIPDGQTSVPFTVVGVDSVTGTPIITVSANGFNDGTAPLQVVQPAVELASLSTSQAAGSADRAFWAQVGVPYAGNSGISQYEPRAFGRNPLTTTFTSSQPTVGTLVTTPLTAGVVTALLGVGVYYTPTSVATGGVAFRPLTAGATTVSITIPGFIQIPSAAGTVVTVTP